jgi:hypothetical protein
MWWEPMHRSYEFKSSCPAPAMLNVCRASRNVAKQLLHYEKLFGNVWFDCNRDTLFLDFGLGFPLQNAYSEDDLPMDDLERVRFVALYSGTHSANPTRARLLSKMMARKINLEKVFLCSVQSRNYIQGTNYSDLIFMAQCPGFNCCVSPHVGRCFEDALHILNCSCVDELIAPRQGWYGRHCSLPGITLPQPGPQIIWRHVLARPSRGLLIANAERMRLPVLP